MGPATDAGNQPDPSTEADRPAIGDIAVCAPASAPVTARRTGVRLALGVATPPIESGGPPITSEDFEFDFARRFLYQANDADRLLWWARERERMFPADIEIEPDDYGRPRAIFRDRNRALEFPNVSISQEETFPRDVADPERLHDELVRMAERLADHLRTRGQTARTVTTKLRYPDFAIRTRSTSRGGSFRTPSAGAGSRALADGSAPSRVWARQP